jgi:hypothetical protein
MIKKSLLITLILFQLAIIFGIFLVNRGELISIDKENRLAGMYERASTMSRENSLVGISQEDFRLEILALKTFDQRRRELIQSSTLGLLLSALASFAFIWNAKINKKE